MKVSFRIQSQLLTAIHANLSRPHPYAAERVGFVSCDSEIQEAQVIITTECWHPVTDEDYVNDSRFGAVINSSAIRKALQYSHKHCKSMFHVHRHDHYGVPSFSYIDQRGNSLLIPDFFKVQADLPHGAIVLSHNSLAGKYWVNNKGGPRNVDSFSIVKKPWAWLGVYA